MGTTPFKEVVMRTLSGIVACSFFASAPIIFFAAESWRKAGVIPVIGFGILFLLYALRGKKDSGGTVSGLE